MAIRIQTGGWKEGEKPEMEVSFEGAVIETRERNGYHDSDFYAVVWDSSRKELREIEYATTRGWTYNNGASADITEELLEEMASVLRPKILEAMKTDSITQANLPKIGRLVRVMGGKNKGFEGRIFWEGYSRFGRNTKQYGIARDGAEKNERNMYNKEDVVWTSAKLKVVNPEVLFDDEYWSDRISKMTPIEVYTQWRGRLRSLLAKAGTIMM